MFNAIRKSIVRRRVIDEIRRLDPHLLQDIGFADHVAKHEPVVLMTRGPFDRDTR